MPLVFTFTAASTVLNLATITACQLIPLSIGRDGPTGDHCLGDQIMAVDVVSNSASESGYLVFMLVDRNQTTDIKRRCVVATFAVHTTPASFLSASAGASGGYVCKVTFDDVTDKIDLLGLAGRSRSVTAASATSVTLGSDGASDLQWYLGVYSMVGTSLSVTLTPTRNN